MTVVTSTAGPRVGLRARIVHAGSWIIGGQLLSQVIRLATNIVLTKLLFPDAFGLMSVVNIMITALGLFSDIGVARSIVQSPRGEEPAMLDTAWTVQIIRGLLQAVGCVVAAFAFAVAIHFQWTKAGTVYADPRLPWILGVFAIVPAVSAFDSIKLGLARRGMHLHVLTKIDMASQAASALCMVVVGIATRSIWTLIVGAFASAVMRCAVSHIVLKGHHERIRIDRTALAELMSHGKWIFLSSILTFLAMNGDRVFLGAVIDSRFFGMYAIALLLINVLQGLAANLCNSIAYPALSEVFRERPQALSSVLQRFQWGYDAFMTFLVATLIAAGPAVVAVIYDPRYRDAGWMLSILAAGSIGLRYQIVEQSYQAVGTPKYLTLANCLRLVALVAGVLLGQRFWGLHGALAGVALAQFAAWPVAIWFKARHSALTWRAEALFPPALVLGLACGWAVATSLAWLLPRRFM
jgi:O-antigen/teichoic acid export membrane protein